MPLPEFNKIQQNKNAVPNWAKHMKDGEFISYEVTYKTKIYFDLLTSTLPRGHDILRLRSC